MKLRFYSILLCLFLLPFACADSSASDALLEEAFAVHKEAMAHSKEVEALISKLPAGDPSVESLKTRLDNWSHDLIEVPGFEHDHQDHDHDHDPKLELTPEDMLLVQKEMRDSILMIKQAVETMK